MFFSKNKEMILTYILFSYIAGFSFYASITTNVSYVFIICPLVTYFIGHYVFESIIMKSVVEYKIKQKLLVIIITMIYSIFTSNILIGTSTYLYENEIIGFLIEPITFGFMYGALYMIFIKLIYKNTLFQEVHINVA